MTSTDTRFVRIPVGELETNTYLLHAPESRECLVIDPGADALRIRSHLEKLGLIPAMILLTHCHIDHTGGVTDLMNDYPVPLAAHADAVPLLQDPFNREMAAAFGLALPPPVDRSLKDGEELQVAGMTWRIMHTPGHSPGSICLLADGLLVSGDTLFHGSVGRTDLPGGDFALLQESLERLKSLSPQTIVLPGHGETSIMEREMRHNPFL